MAAAVVNQLGIDLVQTAEDVEPRDLGRPAHLCPNPALPALAGYCPSCASHGLLGHLPGLARLTPDVLAMISNSLAFIGFGRADLPDVGRHLPPPLLFIAQK